MEKINLETVTKNYLKYKEYFNSMGYTLDYQNDQLLLKNNGKEYSLTNISMKETTLEANCITDDGTINILLGENNLSLLLTSSNQVLKNIQINDGEQEVIIEGCKEAVIGHNNILYGIHKKGGYYAARIIGKGKKKNSHTFEQSIEIDSTAKQVMYFCSSLDLVRYQSKVGQIRLIPRGDSEVNHYIVANYRSNEANNPQIIVNKILSSLDSDYFLLAITRAIVVEDLISTVSETLKEIFGQNIGSYLPLPINVKDISVGYLNWLVSVTNDHFNQVTLPEVVELGKGKRR